MSAWRGILHTHFFTGLGEGFAVTGENIDLA
jgi:hypothetical protein